MIKAQDAGTHLKEFWEEDTFEKETLKDCIKKQKELNKLIFDKFNLQQIDVKEELLLALKVELAELANETNCFKYWKENPTITEEAKEELADVFHFLLSIIIVGDCENEITMDFDKVEKSVYTPTKLFNNMFKTVSELNNDNMNVDVKLQYITDLFIKICKYLRVREEDLIKLYNAKYEKNIKRQENGY